MHVTAAAVLAALVWISTTAIGAQSPPAARPDLSGYWGPGRGLKPDQATLDRLPPNTVFVADAGATELPAGDYGGLRPRPAALEAARRWRPEDDLALDRVCQPPSIVYAMQGPFPMEIYQGTEFIIFKLEYYDMVRIVFMDGRPRPPADAPHSKAGFSLGRWEGSTLVVETTHLSESTITNNGLNHSDRVRVTERFWLSDEGKTLVALQEFEDPEALDNRGARLIAWTRTPGQYVLPYECDPTFGINYQRR